MKRSLYGGALSLSLVLSVTLTGCGSDESDSARAPSAAQTSLEASASPEAPSYEGNDATATCAEISKQSAPILMKALENADKPDEVSAAYNELADLYEAGVSKVAGQDVKDAFQALADSYRKDAKGESDSDAANKANQDFGAACFGG